MRVRSILPFMYKSATVRRRYCATSRGTEIDSPQTGPLR